MLLRSQLFPQVPFIQIFALCTVTHHGTQFAFVIGYGLLIPIALHLPFSLCEQLQLQNKQVITSVAVIGIVDTFRFIKAFYDTSPSLVAEASIGNYMAYYSSLMHFEWDPVTRKRQKITTAELRAIVLRIRCTFHFYPSCSLWKFTTTLSPLPVLFHWTDTI